MEKISCIAAADSAMKRTGNILFHPFDLGYWLLLSLCAWISLLGQSIAPIPGFNFSRKSSLHEMGLDRQEIRAAFKEAADGDWSPLLHLLGLSEVTLAVILLVIVLGMVVMAFFLLLGSWLKAQGDFLFIDHLVRGRPGLLNSFHANLRRGNSSFLWKLGYHVVSMLLVALALLLPLLPALRWFGQCLSERALHSPDALTVTGMVLSALSFIGMITLMKIVFFYYHEFIVPLMYIKELNAWAAAGAFWRLFRANTWQMIKYLLLIAILRAAIFVGLLIIIVMTCCTLSIPLVLPWVWAVLLLPLLVFLRLCSLELLNQFYKNEQM